MARHRMRWPPHLYIINFGLISSKCEIDCNLFPWSKSKTSYRYCNFINKTWIDDNMICLTIVITRGMLKCVSAQVYGSIEAPCSKATRLHFDTWQRRCPPLWLSAMWHFQAWISTHVLVNGLGPNQHIYFSDLLRQLSCAKFTHHEKKKKKTKTCWMYRRGGTYM